MSKMANPAGTRSLGTSRRSAARSRLGATTAPRGRISFAPALAMTVLAMSSLSRSTSEPPTPKPIARKNVLAIGFGVGGSLVERDKEDLIYPRQQRLDHVDFPRDLGAAQHGHEPSARFVECIAQVAELPLHEKARDCGLEQARHRLGGGVRTVRRPERVVHEEVAQRRERRGELGIVVFFSRPKA